MYDPQQLLNLIDANRSAVLIAFGIDSLLQVWWLTTAAIVAKRDRAYSIPLVCTYFWFAHDFAVVIRFREWFWVLDHWYLQLYWLVLLAACVLECFYLWQVQRYGRREWLPDWQPRSFALLLAAGMVFALGSHEFFKYAFGDPLFQMDPTLTMLAYPAFGAAMLIRRRSNRGQSATMWWTFTCMTAGFHSITYLWFGEAFRAWPYVMAGALATLGGFAMALTVSSPRWRWDGRDFAAGPAAQAISQTFGTPAQQR
jgi:hypothetical protein